jgi:hypothetical protein
MDSISLDNYVCKLCKAEIYLEDGYWQCECISVGYTELSAGILDLPKEWQKRRCISCEEEVGPPYGSVILVMGEKFYVCVECQRTQDREENG